MRLERKFTTYAFVVIVVVSAILMFYNVQHNSRKGVKQKIRAIPFIVFPENAFRQGYVDGYIGAKKLAIIETNNSIEVKINLTYIGRKTAPKMARIRPCVGMPEVSIPSSMARMIFDRNSSPKLRGTIDYLVKSGVLMYDNQSRAWIDTNKLIYIEPSVIEMKRNTSTIIVLSIKPSMNLNLAAKSLLCQLLIERIAIIGIGGGSSLSFYVESNPNIRSFPILVPTMDLINRAICNNV